MTIEKNGQLAWTFEELDLEGAVKEVEKQYDLLREQVRHTRNYPRTHKALIKRCSVLLDVRENIYKLMERGAF